MNTVLTILALSALLALVLGRLEVNHRRSTSAPWTAPLGADVRLDHEADRVGAELSALAAHRPAEAVPGTTEHHQRPRSPRRPLPGVPRAA